MAGIHLSAAPALLRSFNFRILGPRKNIDVNLYPFFSFAGFAASGGLATFSGLWNKICWLDMGNLVAAVMASALLGVVAAPIMALSLQSVKDRADSSLSLDAEAKALSVRKRAAASDSLSILNGQLRLTVDGVTDSLTLPQGCTVSEDQALQVAKVTCSSSRGGRVGTNTQPLYAADDFIGMPEICYSTYRSQSDSSPTSTVITTLQEFNELLTAPGNSAGGGGGFFTRLHLISDQNCQLARASGSQTYVHPAPSGASNSSFNPGQAGSSTGSGNSGSSNSSSSNSEASSSSSPSSSGSAGSSGSSSSSSSAGSGGGGNSSSNKGNNKK